MSDDRPWMKYRRQCPVSDPKIEQPGSLGAFPVLTPELAAYAQARGVGFYSFTEPEIRGVIDFAEAGGLTVTEAMVAMVDIVRSQGMEASLAASGQWMN